MSDALEDHRGSVSIGGRIKVKFRFTDDIVVNAEEEDEAGDIVTSMDTAHTRYKIEIWPDKTKKDKQFHWLSKRDQDKRSKARSKR